MTGKKNREEPAVHDSLGCGVPDNESCWIWLVSVATDTGGYGGTRAGCKGDLGTLHGDT